MENRKKKKKKRIQKEERIEIILLASLLSYWEELTWWDLIQHNARIRPAWKSAGKISADMGEAGSSPDSPDDLCEHLTQRDANVLLFSSWALYIETGINPGRDIHTWGGSMSAGAPRDSLFLAMQMDPYVTVTLQSERLSSATVCCSE